MSRPAKQTTVLGALARQDRWTQARFVDEYGKTAERLYGDRAGLPPNVRTVRHWFAGDSGRPHPDNCHVIEAMYPGYRAEELFAPFDPSVGIPEPDPRHMPTRHQPSRPEWLASGSRAAEMRKLMSWVDINSPVKERDIDRTPTAPQTEQPQQVRRGLRIFNNDGLVQENFIVGDRVIKVHHSTEAPETGVARRDSPDRRRSR